MGKGPSQRSVPTQGLLGARLPWAPARPLPSCNGKQLLRLIPGVSNPNHRMVRHVAHHPLSHSRPLASTKHWALTGDTPNSSSLCACFVTTTSTRSKQLFPYPYSSALSPCPKFNPGYPRILAHPLQHTMGAGGCRCRGSPVQHGFCSNHTVASCEPEKVPATSAMAYGVQTLPSAFWGNSTYKMSYP